MKHLKILKKQKVAWQASFVVKEGVVCDVFVFNENTKKDAAIVTIQKGYKSPRQQILKGDKTIQGWLSGKAKLIIEKIDGKISEYKYPEDQNDVEVRVGEIMEWEALEDLMYYEICYPPYKKGRFKDL